MNSRGTPKKKEMLILDRDAAILRDIAVPVSREEIGSPKLAKLVEKMHKALYQEEDGVAIAAPQVGVGLRMFMVKGRMIEPEASDRIYINPEIVRRSKKKAEMEEGCLSVRWLYGEVARHEKVTLKALDEQGKLHTIGASKLMAQIFQHEVDHLDGILFIDKAKNLRDLPPTDEPEQG